MLPPSGQPLSKSECSNLGHDPGKQDGGSTSQCFEAFLVTICQDHWFLLAQWGPACLHEAALMFPVYSDHAAI